MMQVLGVDPSLTCTGAAIVGTSGLIFPTRFQTKPAKTLADLDQRIRYITGNVLKFAASTDLLTVIEAPFVPRHASGQVLERAWLFGMLVDQLLLRGPVVAVNARTRAKYGAGDGNADKKKVLAAVRLAFPNITVRDDNEGDAMVLASMGIRHLGAPIDGDPSKKQLEAMAAVDWPTREETK